MPRITRRPAAERDLSEQADYLRRHSGLEVALRFLDSAEATFRTLAEWPERGSHYHFRRADAKGLRVWRIDVFNNHLIFYRPIQDGIDVVRVIHGARNIDRVLDECDDS